MIVSPPFVSTSSGGGSGGGNIPLLSQFSWLDQVSGATATNTTPGLAVFAPTVFHGGAGAALLEQNAGVPSAFTIDVGFTSDLGTQLGATQTYGAFIILCQSMGTAFKNPYAGTSYGLQCQAGDPLGTVRPSVSFWTRMNLGAVQPTTKINYPSALSPNPIYFRLIYNGSTFQLYFGSSLGSLTFWQTIPSTTPNARTDGLDLPPDIIGFGCMDQDGPVSGVNATFTYYNVT